eukprot:SAG22_NODE_5065_length_1095_cov_0.824297_2_plen_173_part_01
MLCAASIAAAWQIRWVGFSTHGMEPIISAACATGKFDYVNLHYQFIGSFTASGSGASGGTWPAIVAARKSDMGVFIISPTDKGGQLYKPPTKFAELTAPLSPIEFNNLWLLGARRESLAGDTCAAISLFACLFVRACVRACGLLLTRKHVFLGLFAVPFFVSSLQGTRRSTRW